MRVREAGGETEWWRNPPYTLMLMAELWAMGGVYRSRNCTREIIEAANTRADGFGIKPISKSTHSGTMTYLQRQELVECKFERVSERTNNKRIVETKLTAKAKEKFGAAIQEYLNQEGMPIGETEIGMGIGMGVGKIGVVGIGAALVAVNGKGEGEGEGEVEVMEELRSENVILRRTLVKVVGKLDPAQIIELIIER